jgi:hypothetical protein
MPGNFYPELEIDEHGCISPAGPLDIPKGEKVVRLDAWVWQDSSACIAFQLKFPHKDWWETTSDPRKNHVGASFRPGAAVAMALMVTEEDGEMETYHWTDSVLLFQKGMTCVPVQSASKSEAV